MAGGHAKCCRLGKNPQVNLDLKIQTGGSGVTQHANPASPKQSWASTGRLTVKLNKNRGFPKLDSREKKQETIQSSVIVFCEKTTGVAQFRTESGADSEFGVERLAGLVAMQWLGRGHRPNDFFVLSAAGEISGGPAGVAREGLTAGGAGDPQPGHVEPATAGSASLGDSEPRE